RNAEFGGQLADCPKGVRSLFTGRQARLLSGVLVAHDLAGAKRHDPPRRNRYFDPGLGIAADPLSLVAQDDGAKARNLHILALAGRMAHVMEHALDDPRALGAGHAKPVVDDVRKI